VSIVTLDGHALNAAFGWWWADTAEVMAASE
jgi:hypothetical protein